MSARQLSHPSLSGMESPPHLIYQIFSPQSIFTNVAKPAASTCASLNAPLFTARNHRNELWSVPVFQSQNVLDACDEKAIASRHLKKGLKSHNENETDAYIIDSWGSGRASTRSLVFGILKKLKIAAGSSHEFFSKSANVARTIRSLGWLPALKRRLSSKRI